MERSTHGGAASATDDNAISPAETPTAAAILKAMSYMWGFIIDANP
jgi:hypothetical protein